MLTYSSCLLPWHGSRMAHISLIPFNIPALSCVGLDSRQNQFVNCSDGHMSTHGIDVWIIAEGYLHKEIFFAAFEIHSLTWTVRPTPKLKVFSCAPALKRQALWPEWAGSVRDPPQKVGKNQHDSFLFQLKKILFFYEQIRYFVRKRFSAEASLPSSESGLGAYLLLMP